MLCESGYGNSTVPAQCEHWALSLPILLNGFFLRLKYSLHTYILVSTQLNTPGGPSADSQHSLCVASSSTELCPVNSSFLVLPGLTAHHLFNSLCPLAPGFCLPVSWSSLIVFTGATTDSPHSFLSLRNHCLSLSGVQCLENCGFIYFVCLVDWSVISSRKVSPDPVPPSWLDAKVWHMGFPMAIKGQGRQVFCFPGLNKVNVSNLHSSLVQDLGLPCERECNVENLFLQGCAHLWALCWNAVLHYHSRYCGFSSPPSSS